MFQRTSHNSSIVRLFDIVCSQAVKRKNKLTKEILFSLGYPILQHWYRGQVLKILRKRNQKRRRKGTRNDMTYFHVEKEINHGGENQHLMKFVLNISKNLMRRKGCVEFLFQNQAASDAMVQFRGLQWNPRDCYNIFNLSRLDAIMNSSIDLFHEIFTMEWTNLYHDDYHNAIKE